MAENKKQRQTATRLVLVGKGKGKSKTVGIADPIRRYLKADAVLRASSIIESFGSVSMGGCVVGNRTEVRSYGLRGDMAALGFDYANVLSKNSSRSPEGDPVRSSNDRVISE